MLVLRCLLAEEEPKALLRDVCNGSRQARTARAGLLAPFTTQTVQVTSGATEQIAIAARYR
jgi:hypothetical protein